MNQLQLSILTLCNHIAYVRGWDITTTIDCGRVEISFECHESEQENCWVDLYDTATELDLKIIFANLLDILHCNTIKLQNGSMNCEKLND